MSEANVLEAIELGFLEIESPPRDWTPDEFLERYHNRRAELVRGEVIEMSPASANHGLIAGEIFGRLYAHVTAHNLGRVFAAETGFVLSRNPTTVRAPDAAFISHARMGDSVPRRGYWPFAPDLAVEVMSPGDSGEEIAAKIADWFEAGTRLVWVLYPFARTVHVFPTANQSQILSARDTLEGGELLPGFECAVEELFR
jgi:Uma2 family endonuclease